MAVIATMTKVIADLGMTVAMGTTIETTAVANRGSQGQGNQSEVHGRSQQSRVEWAADNVIKMRKPVGREPTDAMDKGSIAKVGRQRREWLRPGADKKQDSWLAGAAEGVAAKDLASSLWMAKGVAIKVAVPRHPQNK